MSKDIVEEEAVNLMESCEFEHGVKSCDAHPSHSRAIIWALRLCLSNRHWIKVNTVFDVFIVFSIWINSPVIFDWMVKLYERWH